MISLLSWNLVYNRHHLQGTQKVSKDYDDLKALLDDLHNVLDRAQVYTKLAVEQSEQVNQVVVDCLVLLLEILGLAARAVKKGARGRTH